jgi:hypothetical protein
MNSEARFKQKCKINVDLNFFNQNKFKQILRKLLDSEPYPVQKIAWILI